MANNQIDPQKALQRVMVVLTGAAAIALSAAAMGVVARYRQEIQRARRRVDGLISAVLETDCGPVEYARNGTGYPVLVVHGAMGGFDAGLTLAHSFLNGGFQAISVSRVGYLRSSLPENPSVDLQVDAYVRLLDSLGIHQAAVLAVSAGATSAIRFAGRYPERTSALILVSPAAPGAVPVVPPPKAALPFMRNNFTYWALITYLRPVMQQMIGVPAGLPLSPQNVIEIESALAETLPSRQRLDGFVFDNYGVDAEFYGEIDETSPYSADKIEVPVLVIHALDDPRAIPENVRNLAGKFPDARRIAFPHGGHTLLGHSAEIYSEIWQFLHSRVARSNRSQELPALVPVHTGWSGQ